jgi:hypothetical protein
MDNSYLHNLCLTSLSASLFAHGRAQRSEALGELEAVAEGCAAAGRTSLSTRARQPEHNP